MQRKIHSLLVLIVIALLPASDALAHGTAHGISGFSAGFSHVFTGQFSIPTLILPVLLVIAGAGLVFCPVPVRWVGYAAVVIAGILHGVLHAAAAGIVPVAGFAAGVVIAGLAAMGLGGAIAWGLKSARRVARRGGIAVRSRY